MLENLHRINQSEISSKLGFSLVPPLIEFSHLKVPAGSTEQTIKEMARKYSTAFLSRLSFTLMSLMLQIDYNGKPLRPLLEAADPLKEGKLPLETFKSVLKMNTNGNGLDLWLTEAQVADIIDYLDPCVTSTHRQNDSFKIDYLGLLFQLEKPVSFQLAKNTKVPSLAFYHALYLAAEGYMDSVVPNKL